jgi:hypothetical protein
MYETVDKTISFEHTLYMLGHDELSDTQVRALELQLQGARAKKGSDLLRPLLQAGYARLNDRCGTKAARGSVGVVIGPAPSRRDPKVFIDFKTGHFAGSKGNVKCDASILDPLSKDQYEALLAASGVNV